MKTCYRPKPEIPTLCCFCMYSCLGSLYLAFFLQKSIVKSLLAAVVKRKQSCSFVKSTYTFKLLNGDQNRGIIRTADHYSFSPFSLTALTNVLSTRSVALPSCADSSDSTSETENVNSVEYSV